MLGPRARGPLLSRCRPPHTQNPQCSSLRLRSPLLSFQVFCSSFFIPGVVKNFQHLTSPASSHRRHRAIIRLCCIGADTSIFHLARLRRFLSFLLLFRHPTAITASSTIIMATAVRSTALRAGGACVRCRKGKTKCVYENGRAPCKNCAKGFHECYLPSESMSHGGHGVSPARVQQRVRESLPSDRAVSSTTMDRQAPPASGVSRHVSVTTEKYVLLTCSFSIVFFCCRPFFFFCPLRMVPWLPPRTPENGPIFPARPPFPQTANLDFRVSVLSLRGLSPTFAQHPAPSNGRELPSSLSTDHLGL